MIAHHSSFGTATLATVVAGVANVFFDSLFNIATLLIRRSAPVSEYIRSVGPLTLLSLPLYVPLVGLMVFGYQHYSFWTAAMFLLQPLRFNGLFTSISDSGMFLRSWLM